MTPPIFFPSLDEFPGLLDISPQPGRFLGGKVVKALAREIGHENFPSRKRLFWILNDLRHRFHLERDEHSSMAFADLVLAVEPSHDYTLSVLSEWRSEPALIVRELLDKATRFREFPSLYTNCLKKAGEICQHAGLEQTATLLLLAWQNLPTPNYPELQGLPLPVKKDIFALNLTPILAPDHNQVPRRRIPHSLAVRERALSSLAMGLKKSEVAQMLGVSRSTLYRWQVRQRQGT